MKTITDLIYYQQLEIRDEICSMKFDWMTDVELYKMQGEILAQLGFSKYDAHYPNDTWVGTLRREGWEKVNKRPKPVTVPNDPPIKR